MSTGTATPVNLILEALRQQMEPEKKRRQLFSSQEYRKAKTLEEAAWMAREETKWFEWL